MNAEVDVAPLQRELFACTRASVDSEQQE